MGRRSPGRQVVALDFESYWDGEYSLSKKELSTSLYVRDPRFEAISCAIKVGDGPVEVYFGKDIKRALARIKWEESSLLCHHAHFDGLILTHHYGHRPAFYYDTLSMGRGLHPKFERNDLGTLTAKYGVTNKREMPDFKGKRAKDLTPEEREGIRLYNQDDVVGMVEIFEKMLPQVPEKELRLIDLTVRMFTEPCLRLNEKLARKELAREKRERKQFIAASGALALAKQFDLTLPKLKKGERIDDEKVLSSNKVFPGILRSLGVEPPLKPKRGKFAKPGEMTYALSKDDEEFTDLLVHPDARVVAAVRGRLAAKSTIGETRAARLLSSGSDGKSLPVYLNYCGAHTTRWSGGDKLNYQNLKKKGEIRKAIMAPEGYQLVVIDSSTIEVRVLAWLAGETWLLEAFRQGLDPYCVFGSDVYGRTITKADKLERFISKTCVLGLGFQMGGLKLQKSILAASIKAGLDPVRLDLPVCFGLVNKYRSKNQRIEALWEFMHRDVIDELCYGGKKVREYKVLEYGREFIRLRNNFALHYPEASAKVSKPKKSSLFRASTEQVPIVEDASYRTPMGRSKIYGGLLTENVVQYLARHVVAEQMLKISERYQVVMMTHDEVVFLARDAEAEEALKWGLEIMKTSPEWAPDMPVSAEGGYDSIYSK